MLAIEWRNYYRFFFKFIKRKL